jgi:hypothetical protein
MPRDRQNLLLRIWRDAPFLSLGLVAALILVGYFAVKLTLGALYWTDPARQNVPLAGWMTPRFVAHSWSVPPDLVATTLDLERDGTGQRVTLKQLAARKGVPVTALITDLEVAIAAFRASDP